MLSIKISFFYNVIIPYITNIYVLLDVSNLYIKMGLKMVFSPTVYNGIVVHIVAEGVWRGSFHTVLITFHTLTVLLT